MDRSRHEASFHNVGLVTGDEVHDVRKWEQVWNDRLELESMRKALGSQPPHDEVHDVARS